MAAQPQFFTYMLTNADRTVLYAGMTNNLQVRLIGHRISTDTFASVYKAYYLVWFEQTRYVLNAIDREDELKRLSRAEKDAIVNRFNPDWRFLNAEIVGLWPPSDVMMDEVRELYRKEPEREWR